MHTHINSPDKRTPFASLARRYLRTLDVYREAKTAVQVAQQIGHDTRDLEYHAAELQAEHQQSVVDLVSCAVRLREQGAA